MLKTRVMLFFAFLATGSAALVGYRYGVSSIPQPQDRVARAARVLRTPEVKPSREAGTSQPAFQWVALESTNYREYIANLRRISCPEETIVDIVLSDIRKLYAARWRSQVGKGAKFWASMKSENDRRAKLKESLQLELRLITRELLGVDLGEELRKFDFVMMFDADALLEFLSEDKRKSLREIRTKWDRAPLTGNSEQEQAVARGKNLRACDAELRALLTPEEFQQYQLTCSPVAQGIRDELFDFEPSKEEFAVIFAAQDVFFTRKRPEEGGMTSSQAMAAMHEAIKQGLGEERYGKFARAGDRDYRTLYLLARTEGLEESVVETAYQAIRSAEALNPRVTPAEAVRMTPDEAARMFQLMESASEERRKRLYQILGMEGYAKFQALLLGQDQVMQGRPATK